MSSHQTVLYIEYIMPNYSPTNTWFLRLPSCISLPPRNANPDLSLISPLIFGSLLIKQGL